MHVNEAIRHPEHRRHRKRVANGRVQERSTASSSSHVHRMREPVRGDMDDKSESMSSNLHRYTGRSAKLKRAVNALSRSHRQACARASLIAERAV